MCQEHAKQQSSRSSSSSRLSSMVTPKLVTVLQFCALCCLHAACQPCAASHAGGHRSLSSIHHNALPAGEWSVMEDDHDHDETNTTTETSDADAQWVENAKYTLMPVIFILTCLTSALPWYVRRLAKAVDFLTIGACFTAGIILGAALSHLMPEAMATWTEYVELTEEHSEEEESHGGHSHADGPFNIVPPIAGAVILTLVWVDAYLVRKGMSGNGSGGHGHSHGHGGGFTPADNGHSHMVPALPEEYYALERKLAAEKREKELAKKMAKDPNYGSVAMAPTPAAHATVAAAPVIANGHDKVVPIATSSNGETGEVTFHIPPQPEPLSDAREIVIATAATEPSPHIAIDTNEPTSPTAIHVAPMSSSHVSHGHGHAHGNHGHGHDTVPERTPSAADKIDALRGSKKQIAQATIFFVALSIHSIFDGLSIGTEDSRDGFSALLVAIGGHKLLDGFALGVPIFFANWSTRTNIAAIVFAALMTPLGIGISMAAHAATDGNQAVLTRCVILAMSLGSFLFISLVELLPAGLDNGKNINAKLFATCVGWGLMVLLAKYV